MRAAWLALVLVVAGCSLPAAAPKNAGGDLTSGNVVKAPLQKTADGKSSDVCENPTAKINVQVNGGSGKPAAGVAVSVTRTSDTAYVTVCPKGAKPPASEEGTSDALGIWRSDALQTGTYAVTATRGGITNTQQAILRIHEDVNLTLTVADLAASGPPRP